MAATTDSALAAAGTASPGGPERAHVDQGGAMSRRYFGTDGIRGLANSPPMTSEIALKVGMAAGKLFSSGAAPAPRGDRQGHAAVGLHDRVGADVGLHRRRHGRVPAGADADAGGRHAHALAARRPRRDDLGLPQPLRGQRHQAVRPRRLQAVRRGRGADRGADGGADRPAAGARRPDRPRQAHRERAGALHRVSPSARCRATSASTTCASSSIAPTAPATRWRPTRCGSWAPRSSRSASSPTATTSTSSAARPRPRRCAPRCARCAPTSASRWTATPTAW